MALIELMSAILAKGRAFRFQARGWSMNPFIHNGDVIYVSSFQKKKPSVGEVVAYSQPTSEKLVVHRLVRRLGDKWLILGDNSIDAIGEQVPDSNLIGRVIRIERDGKKVWLGLGPERYLIALFSRTGSLMVVLAWIKQGYYGKLRR
jgi:signal peptidase I